METMDVPGQANDWAATAETLVALGAPLSGWRPNRRLAPEVALAFALRFASTDASLLRSLPVVLARTWRELDWSKLEKSARAQDSLALLGMLTELTASLAALKNSVRRRDGGGPHRARRVTSSAPETTSTGNSPSTGRRRWPGNGGSS